MHSTYNKYMPYSKSNLWGHARCVYNLLDHKLSKLFLHILWLFLILKYLGRCLKPIEKLLRQHFMILFRVYKVLG